MIAKQIEIQTELSFRANIEYIRRLGIELDPDSTLLLRQAIENEVIKEMLEGGEESSKYFSLTQFSAGN